MFVHRKSGWRIGENAVTPENVYLNRRQFIQSGTIAGVLASTSGAIPSALAAKPALDKHSIALTDEKDVTSYVNFYEFGSHKDVSGLAQAMSIDPWSVNITGAVRQEKTLDMDDLRRTMPMEERITQHRCVEAWAFVAPWMGFPLKELVKIAEPLPEARYLRLTTLADEGSMPGLAQDWNPWPYIEGLTIEEASNDLAFLATGLYGKDLQKQNGAPIRLVLPWKYGFKSIKSIVEIHFSAEKPVSFWETIARHEYGFYANVNPKVPHPRWSQASHRMLGTNERVKTELFNGYSEWVADLYPGYKENQRELFY